MFGSKDTADDELKAIIGQPNYQYRPPAKDGSPLVPIPSGQTTVTVKLINPVSFGPSQIKRFMGPLVPGFDTLEEAPSLCFLLEHPSGRKVIWDLGIREDYHNYAAKVAEYIPTTGYKFRFHGSVADVLRKNGERLDAVESIIWSHWHWDHTGDPSTFPESTALVVGPGFKKAFLPASPENPESSLQGNDWRGRHLREIDFKGAKTLRIGQFSAFDYFEDGSFYLLNSPGHAIGHMCGLARTTTGPDTFVLLGGDVCHHSGIMRPSVHSPLPESIPQAPNVSISSIPKCPGEAFHKLQSSRDRHDSDTLFDMCFGYDIPLATDTVKKIQELDGDGNVFIIIAHDRHVDNIVDHYPANLNSWKERGWGRGARWAFLEDLKPYWDRERSSEVS